MKRRTDRAPMLAVLALVALLAAPSVALASPVLGGGSHPYIGTRPSPAAAGSVGASSRAYASTSTNWGGYTVQTAFPTGANNAVSDVSGTWVVPTVTGGGAFDAYSAVWVGIDGFSSPTVEQLGTEEDWIGGAPYYAAWWEMYPGASVNIPSMSVHPGDVMTARVQWISGNQYNLSMTNATTGQSFSTAQSIVGAERSSAEWIVEAPASNTGILPLAQLSPTVLSACSVTVNGTAGSIGGAGWQNDAMTLVDGTGATLAVPSALTAGGTAFTVTEPGAAGGGDLTAPSTTSDVLASYDNVAAVHLSATDNPGGSGVASTWYQLDGGAATMGTTINVSTYDMHSIKFWSVDVAGNSETPHTVSFMVNDTIAPSTTSDVAAGYTGIAVIHLTASDNAGGSGVSLTRYSLDGVVAVVGNAVTVTQQGAHTLSFYSVDKAGNIETSKTVGFAIAAGVAPSTITIARNVSSILYPRPFVLSGVLTPGSVGDLVAVWVRKPGSVRWSYSSNRLAYAASGPGALWWYRYTPRLRGTYSFRAQFVGDAARTSSTSVVIGVTVR